MSGPASRNTDPEIKYSRVRFSSKDGEEEAEEQTPAECEVFPELLTPF